jgi:hypothetical protein
MTIRGHVQNGVVVIDGAQSLPEGAQVEVSLVLPKDNSEQGPLRNLLLEFAGTVEGLPSDMAEQHDHYIHRRPKKCGGEE